MVHSTQMKYSEVAPDSFDFAPSFRFISKFLKSPDLLMGNLETVLAGRVRGFKGYPVFNTPDQLLNALKETGFDHLFLSNNHIMDMGWKGAVRTAELIRRNGLTYSGISVNRELEDSVSIRIVKGVRIAVLSFTYDYNSKRADSSSVIFGITKKEIEKLLETAEKMKAEVKIVYFHFGDEYSRKPNALQKKAVKWAVDSGADFIFASHPHVIQPVEFIRSEKSVFDSVLTAYSLGNFISNQRWRFSDCGVALNVEFEKNIISGSFKLSKVSFLPLWVYKGRTSSDKFEYILYPSYPGYFEKLPSFFTKNDSANYTESYEDTKRIIDSLGVVIPFEKIN
jgi:poly-gamma-glutamate synthesis protein (capsule biosynthesis protein)